MALHVAKKSGEGIREESTRCVGQPVSGARQHISHVTSAGQKVADIPGEEQRLTVAGRKGEI